MTEKEKMLAGELYDPTDKELQTLSSTAHDLCKVYNGALEKETVKKKEILKKLLPNTKENIVLAGPIFFDYGVFTTIGKNFYANFNFTVLDSRPVNIGDNVMIGPNCSIVTPVHPMRYQERNIRFKKDGSPFDYEYAKPITIGSDCWIASNVTITGGVRIGRGSVIGAGSVVINDIPPNVFAAGNPCRVIREITEKDAMVLPEDK